MEKMTQRKRKLEDLLHESNEIQALKKELEALDRSNASLLLAAKKGQCRRSSRVRNKNSNISNINNKNKRQNIAHPSRSTEPLLTEVQEREESQDFVCKNDAAALFHEEDHRTNQSTRAAKKKKNSNDAPPPRENKNRNDVGEDVVEEQIKKDTSSTTSTSTKKNRSFETAHSKISNEIEAIESHIECPICLEPMTDTHISPECLHRFCGSCFKESLRKCNNECPTCRMGIPTKRHLRSDPGYDELIQCVQRVKKVSTLLAKTEGEGTVLEEVGADLCIAGGGVQEESYAKETKMERAAMAMKMRRTTRTISRMREAELPKIRELTELQVELARTKRKLKEEAQMRKHEREGLDKKLKEQTQLHKNERERLDKMHAAELSRLKAELEECKLTSRNRETMLKDEDEKVHGDKKITCTLLEDGFVYRGECTFKKIRIKHGRGKVTYSNGDVYVGDWKFDNRDGRGKITYSNGDVYVGDWKFDKRDGSGKVTYSNGDVYEGEWKDDKINGRGKITYENSEVYEGQFQDDKIHGQGKFKYACYGVVYEGAWKYNTRDGHGKYTYENGAVYEGLWKNDKKHGQGTLTYANGDMYEGEFKDDNFHGLGKFKSQNSYTIGLCSYVGGRGTILPF